MTGIVRLLLVATAFMVGGSILVGCGSASQLPVDTASAPRIASSSPATPTPVAAGARTAAQGPSIAITGRVKDVAADGREIHLEESVHGFTDVVLTERTQIIGPDGSPRTVQDIQPGAVIQASGTADGQGGVLARTIKLQG